jgi:LPXTG-motif cell wall-anchored protein
MKRVIVFLVAMPLLAFSSLASALTCDDVAFSAEITSRFADAQDACIEVIERDGQAFVKMNVELVRDGSSNRLTFKFKNRDGSFGPTHSLNPASDWRANIAGRSFRARELLRGQELSVYVPSDRWEAHVDAPEAVVETFTLIVITAPAEPEPMMLPSTASNMPLFALFGGLALFGAGLIRVTRRQTS